MKLMRGLLCITMVLSLLTGCSNNEEFDVNEVLEKSIENYDSTLSSEMTMEMVMDVSIEAEGAKINMNMDMYGEVATVVGPGKTDSTSHMNFEVSMNSSDLEQTESNEAYVVTNADGVISYTNDGEGWVKSTSTNDLFSLYSTTKEITELAKTFSPKAIGIKDINGVECYVIELTLDQDSIDFSQYEQLSDLSTIEEFSVTIDIYISTDDYMMMGGYMNLSTFGNDLFTSIMDFQRQDVTEAYDIKISEFYIEIKAKEYGKLDEIIIPDEALEAQADYTINRDEEEKDYYGHSYEKVTGDVSTQTNAWQTLTTTTPYGDIVLDETTIGDLFNYGYNDYSNEVTATTTNNKDGYLATYFAKGDTDFFIGTDTNKDIESLQDLKITTILLHKNSVGLSIPSEIKYGSTLSDIEEAYGEPDTYTVWNNGLTELHYSMDKAYLLIRVEDGKVKEIMMTTSDD